VRVRLIKTKKKFKIFLKNISSKTNQMIQIAVAWRFQFQCAKANVIQSFVINAKHFVSVLNLLLLFKQKIK